MNIASRGATMAVDWEQRVDFDRLRRTGSSGRKRRSPASDLGAAAALRPEQPPLRHEHRDRHVGAGQEHPLRPRVPRGGDPILWDFGSAARHHQLYCPWLPEASWRAWVPPMRGAMPDQTGVPDALAAWSSSELRERGLDGDPRRPRRPRHDDAARAPAPRLELADSQPVMLEARKLKSADELALLDQAAGIVDAAYERSTACSARACARATSSRRR